MMPSRIQVSRDWTALFAPELWATLMVVGFVATMLGPAWLGNIAIWLLLAPLLVVIVAGLLSALSGVIGRLFRR